jgi:hypothetical protein
MLSDAFYIVSLNVVMLRVIMLNGVMLSIVLLNAVMLHVVMLSVIMLGVVMLDVVVVIAVGPFLSPEIIFRSQSQFLLKDFHQNISSVLNSLKLFISVNVNDTFSN